MPVGGPLVDPSVLLDIGTPQMGHKNKIFDYTQWEVIEENLALK